MQQSNYLFFTTGCEQALAFYAEGSLRRAMDAQLFRLGIE